MLALVMVLALVLVNDWRDSGSRTASEDDVALGAPVESALPPAVVPSNAEPDEVLTSARVATYVMPEGITESDTLAWYAQHMPSGADFGILRWLEELPAAGGEGPDWYWCSGPGESLDVSFGQNDPSDGGRAFVMIAVQAVTVDDACG